MAWVGPERVALQRLSEAGADAGDDGRVVVGGEPVRVLGKNGDVVVPDGAVFFRRGKPVVLAAMLVQADAPLVHVATRGANGLSVVVVQSRREAQVFYAVVRDTLGRPADYVRGSSVDDVYDRARRRVVREAFRAAEARPNPLLDEAANLFGPLQPTYKKAIMDYLAAPTVEKWDLIAHIVIVPETMRKATIWQWVIEVDPTFPKTGPKTDRHGRILENWKRIPDPMLVARAIKAAAAWRKEHGRKGNPSLAREVESIVKEAARQGCRVKSGKHWKLYCPSGRMIVAAKTPSDQRALANLRADLRRAGVAVNPACKPAAVRGGCVGARYDGALRMKKGGPVPPFLLWRVHEAIAAQPEIACVAVERWACPPGHERLEVGAILSPEYAEGGARWEKQGGLVALDRALTRAARQVSRDLEVTDLGVLVPMRTATIATNPWLPGEEEQEGPLARMEGEGEEALYIELDELPRKQGWRWQIEGRRGRFSGIRKERADAVDELRRARASLLAGRPARHATNPMATADEIVAKIRSWLKQRDLESKDIKFKSPADGFARETHPARLKHG